MKNDPLITTPSDLHTAASEPDDPAEAVLRALNAREVLSPDHANALWWALRSLQTVEVQSLLLVANRMNLSLTYAREQVEFGKRRIQLQDEEIESLGKAIDDKVKGTL